MTYRSTLFTTAMLLALFAPPLAAQEGEAQAARADTAREAMADLSALEISRAVVASAVEEREPMGADSTFTTDVGVVYFFTVAEGDFGEAQLEHVWMHEGQEIARVPLTVQGPRWRTWSSKEIMPGWTGSWTVKVVDATGAEHASVSFHVTESAAEPMPADTMPGDTMPGG